MQNAKPMGSNLTDRSRIRLLELAGPMFVEIMLRTSLMSVDTFMLSAYSEKAVAAMSLANVFCFLIQQVYTMVAVGSNILIAQNLGAGNKKEAGQTALGSYVLVFLFSAALSAVMALFSGHIIDGYHLEPKVAKYARDFLFIYSAFSVFMAINIVQATILRAWGYPSAAMAVNIIALVLTVAGNAVFLFGPFGIPVLGVAGVALSTVLSQVITCGIYARVMSKKKDIKAGLGGLFKVPGRVYAMILKIGVPTGGEVISYNLSQIVIMFMVSSLGTESMAAFGIIMTIVRYIFMPGISIGSGTQIKVSYMVGSGRHDEAHSRVYRYFGAGFSISLGLVLILNLFKHPILRIFTMNPAILSIITAALLVSIFLEPGRNFNTIIIPALKGSGDVKFPVMMGIISMWGISVFGGWLLGIHFKLGVPGIMAAMACDEWSRGITMLIRWRSGVWRKKGLIGRAEK